MFIGHFAVGFAAKRAAPRTSLTALVLSALSPDMVSPIFVWLGIEHMRWATLDSRLRALDVGNYRWSHSVLFVLLFAPLLGLLYRSVTGYSRGALWIGIAAASHWVLDFLSHRPDLPIAPGIPIKLGLELWSSVRVAATVEIGMLAAGLALYASATRARGWLGHISLWSFAVFLVVIYWLDISGSRPPSVESVEEIALAAWGLLLWLVLVDRTHELRPAMRAAPEPAPEPVPR